MLWPSPEVGVAKSELPKEVTLTRGGPKRLHSAQAQAVGGAGRDQCKVGRGRWFLPLAEDCGWLAFGKRCTDEDFVLASSSILLDY